MSAWLSFLSSGEDCDPSQAGANWTAESGVNSQNRPRSIVYLRNDMVSLSDYKDREQSYVKHVFLERYLERLVHKTASAFPHVVYVDGFAGPWQSANEKLEDT